MALTKTAKARMRALLVDGDFNGFQRIFDASRRGRRHRDEDEAIALVNAYIDIIHKLPRAPVPAARLLDATWGYAVKALWNDRDARRKFDTAARKATHEERAVALRLAWALGDTACELASERAGSREALLAELRERCPGFSPKLYEAALAYGQFEMR